MFVVMVEAKTCYRGIWSIIDKIEIGCHQPNVEERSDIRPEMPLNLNQPDFQIGVV